ncbi:MAG TPA: protealysin inhibitor emfourin [Gemmatimonadaceae bacterium]|jgi:hypothetical protein
MTWEVAVRVRFVQSGGIVGAVRECELDTSLLPPDDARELTALVEESGVLTSGIVRAPASRDLRAYEIVIENGAETVSATFDDHTLPDAARPLVTFLRRNAKPRGESAL